MLRNPLPLVVSIAVCLSAGLIGSIFTFLSIPSWYSTLNKPSFAPPNWVFGPVWTTLYILMGIALYLVWIKKDKKKSLAIKLFFAQLGLNALWSVIFFGFRNPLLALVELIILWIAVFLTIRSFLKLSRSAAYFLYPYIAWVSIAAILNLAIVILN